LTPELATLGASGEFIQLLIIITLISARDKYVVGVLSGRIM